MQDRDPLIGLKTLLRKKEPPRSPGGGGGGVRSARFARRRYLLEGGLGGDDELAVAVVEDAVHLAVVFLDVEVVELDVQVLALNEPVNARRERLRLRVRPGYAVLAVLGVEVTRDRVVPHAELERFVERVESLRVPAFAAKVVRPGAGVLGGCVLGLEDERGRARDAPVARVSRDPLPAEMADRLAAAVRAGSAEDQTGDE